METGRIAPVASMVEAGSQTQHKTAITTPAEEPEKKVQDPLGVANIRLAQTKLVIEADSANGGWVYKTVDAKNGQLLAAYPLRSVWEIILSQRSGLGLVVDAKA